MEDSIHLYLLGRLSAGERTEIERRFFAEPGFLASVQIAEEELIRDELAGELPLDERVPFHSYFLSFPDLRAKYEFTRALRDALPRASGIDAAPERSKVADISARREPAAKREKAHFARRGPVLLAAAACAAFLIAGLDDLRRWSESPDHGNAGIATAIQAPAVLAFTLTPGLVRSGRSTQTRFSVPAGTALIRLKLDFERSEHYKTWQAALKPADAEREILRIGDLAAHPDGAFQSIELEIPGSVLGENSYVLTLSGETAGVFEPVEAYTFEIFRPAGK